MGAPSAPANFAGRQIWWYQPGSTAVKSNPSTAMTACITPQYTTATLMTTGFLFCGCVNVKLRLSPARGSLSICKVCLCQAVPLRWTANHPCQRGCCSALQMMLTA